jgi:hypothetical protein
MFCVFRKVWDVLDGPGVKKVANAQQDKGSGYVV